MTALPANPGGGMAISANLPLFGQSGRRGRIPWVNSWLIFLLIFGTIIVLADGFTRDAMPDEGTVAATPVLEYESFWAAFVFAWVSLPLCYLYARKTGASRGEAILLWFVLDTVAYAKDFAYIRVPGLPLFITDIVLALFLFSLLRSMGMRFLLLDRWWSRLVMAFRRSGCDQRGAWCSGPPGADPGRQGRGDRCVFAFLFVGFHVVKTWDGVRRLFIALAAGSVFATLNGLAWFLAQPDQRRFIPYGVFVLASFIGTIVFTINKMIRPTLGWPLAMMLFVGILLDQCPHDLSRGGFRAAGNDGRDPVRQAATQRPQSSPGRGSDRGVAPGAVGGKPDASRIGIRGSSRHRTGFRHAQLLRRSQRHVPIDGVVRGFPAIQRESRARGGVRYPVHLRSRCHRRSSPQHLFDGPLQDGSVRACAVAFVARRLPLEGLEESSAMSSHSQATAMYGLMLGQLLMCLFGVLNLLLESPFLASIFWLTVGIGLRMMSAPPIAAQPRMAPVKDGRQLRWNT